MALGGNAMPLLTATRKHGACGQRIVVVLLLCWAMTAWAHPRARGEQGAQGTSGRLVRIAAAADVKFALDDISAAFRAQH